MTTHQLVLKVIRGILGTLMSPVLALAVPAVFFGHVIMVLTGPPSHEDYLGTTTTAEILMSPLWHLGAALACTGALGFGFFHLVLWGPRAGRDVIESIVG